MTAEKQTKLHEAILIDDNAYLDLILNGAKLLTRQGYSVGEAAKILSRSIARGSSPLEIADMEQQGRSRPAK